MTRNASVMWLIIIGDHSEFNERTVYREHKTYGSKPSVTIFTFTRVDMDRRESIHLNFLIVQSEAQTRYYKK